SPRVYANKPVIDGDVTPGEWNALAGFEFGERTGAGGAASPVKTLAARTRPEFTPRAPRPMVPRSAPGDRTVPVAERRPQKRAPLVLARYDYWYQGDRRKAIPVVNVLRPNGSSAFVQHPLEGTGPWFSYDRADWHRRQLSDLRRAGIDVILPTYRGAAR